MSTAIAKAFASFISAGFCAFSACRALGLSMQVAAPSAAVGAFSGLIFFARVWIQGYYFDKRCSTAAELTGRTAIVTGGTVGGLGYAGAELLASMGATVVVTVRSRAKGEEAVAKLKRAAGHERVSYVVIDFLSKASVRAGAATLTAAHKRLDFLVLNAGVGSGPPAEMWSSNMVLPFLLTQLLTPLLVQTAKEFGDVRVVSVSSGAHKKASINLASPYETESEGAFGGERWASRDKAPALPRPGGGRSVTLSATLSSALADPVRSSVARPLWTVEAGADHAHA